MILTIIKCFVLFCVAITLLFIIGDRIIRSKGYTGPKSDHFNGSKFLNIKEGGVQAEQPGFGKILTWVFSRSKNEWETRAVQQTKPQAVVEGSELVATLINHATVLVQTQGLNIITDPIYSERASPFSFAGPKRFTEPGVAFDDLPHIDVVLISHNHYDHLDIDTLKRLVARDNTKIIVPLGNDAFLQKHGIQNGIELDWWQNQAVSSDVSVVSVPAQHFSARALSDRNKTLWAGYAIQTPGGDIYFAGDTGYGPFVDEIAKHFPNGFRLGLLPIGAFKPQWFMHKVHISPDEAFTIQKQLNIKDVLAIHFGTFKLADDGQDEPAERVQGLQPTLTNGEKFQALPNGNSITVP